MVSGATATMRNFGHQNLGVFFNPNSTGNYTKQTIATGMPWAADNAAYSGFNSVAFERMLDTLYTRNLPGCLFITSPDVVGDAVSTIELFWKWLTPLKRYGWPIALVAQDGLRVCSAPWEKFEALFIGGSTRWKLGADAYSLCAYAKALGKYVHIGRVNSPKRMALFEDVADSVDGTATSRYGNIFIPKMIKAARRTPQRRVVQRELL